MNDSDIGKMLENINTSVPSSLENKVLSNSSKALKRSCLLRKTVRRSVSTLVILLICFGAFMTVQSHEKQEVSNQLYKPVDDAGIDATIDIYEDEQSELFKLKYSDSNDMQTFSVLLLNESNFQAIQAIWR